MPSKLEQMGLVDYLDGTKGLHNGNGFKEFEQLITTVPPANRSLIAERFNVTRPTVYEWLKLYDKIKATQVKTKE